MSAKTANKELFAHAAKVIRDAGYSVLDVYRVDEPSDNGIGQNTVIYTAPGPTPKTAFIDVKRKQGMIQGYTVTVEVEDGW